MKTNNYLLIFSILILTLSFAKGQDFSPLLQKRTNEIAAFSDGISNGDLYLLEQQTNSYYNLGGGFEPVYEKIVDQLEEIEYCFNKLYLFNVDLEIKKEIHFKSNSDSISWALNFQIDEPDDDLVVLVANIQADSIKFYMHWYNLYMEHQHTLAVPAEFQLSANWIGGWNFIINDNNNIVYTGLNGVSEFNKYGKKINSYQFTGEEIDGPLSPFFIQNKRGEYFSAVPQGWGYTFFNQDLSFKQGHNYIFEDPVYKVLRDCSRLALDNKKEVAYLTGFLKIREPCDIGIPRPFRYGEFIYKYDLLEPQNPGVFFIDTPYHCQYKRYGQFAIDLFKDDYIYYSHSDKDCGFIAAPNEIVSCYDTFITLKCLDDEGNLRWSKYLGGDAAYLPQGVVATPDTGVVVFVLRHHPEENERFEADIYVAKFDKLGNPVNLPNAGGLVPINEFALNNTIKVYPNPISNYLIVEGLTPTNQNNLKLYNNVGQLVVNKNLIDNKINLHHLQKGYYTYAILNNEGLIKAGKVLKW